MRLALVLSLAPALSLALSCPAAAQELMTPEAFDTWSTGHTLDYFYSDGTLWGSEAHYSGRVTTDEAEDGCREGRWFPQDGAICFEYENTEGSACWFFWQDGDSVTAKTVESGSDVPPYDVRLSQNPLNCPGPDVGV